MSKYAIARELIDDAKQRADEAGLDPHEIHEALLVLAIENLVQTRGAKDTRQFVGYQLDSVSADGLYEIQRR